MLSFLLKSLLWSGLIKHVKGALSPASTSSVLSRTSEDDGDVCDIYLARSTIPGAGLGIFSGRHFDVYEAVGPSDITIPIHDYYTHHPEIQNETILDVYIWRLKTFNHMDKEGAEAYGFVPGAGAAVNCILPLSNVVGMDNLVEYDAANLHRARDPGSGAFTPFINRQIISKTVIEAGMELFDWYGEAYFSEREHAYGKLPMAADQKKADKFLRKFVVLKNNLQALSSNFSAESDWTKIDRFHDLYSLFVDRLSRVWPSRVLNALPTDIQQVDVLAELGTDFRDYNRSKRSLEWIKEHGFCMDNLVTKQSQINKQAGHGAFAKRRIRNGAVIAPAPVMHMPRKLLEMHPVEVDDEDELFVNTTAPSNHYQLLLNYCLGHPESSFVLCPYGAGTSLINHSKERANAKLSWNMNLTQRPEWLQQAPETFLKYTHTGLVLNVIATRDIDIDEEILIDYGDAWEAAWNHHVETWKPPHDADKYMSAFQLNELDIIPTLYEPNKHNENYVDLYCRSIYRQWAGLMSDEEVDELEREETDVIYCRPMYRFEKNGEMLYVVELYTLETEGNVTQGSIYEVLFAVPRDIFVYHDKFYSRDHVQPWTFRHDIQIPDEIMPDIWKDLKEFSSAGQSILSAVMATTRNSISSISSLL